MKQTVYLLVLALVSCGGHSDQSSSQTDSKATETVDTLQKSVDTENETNNVKTVLGIDVSHYQGDIDWLSIKNDGVLFGYVKATEGDTYQDPRFVDNWDKLSKYDLYKGAYHYYQYEDNALDQAKHYINTVKNVRGDLPPVLDLEGANIESKMSIQSYQKSVSVWLQAVEKALGVKPIIYTNYSFADKYLNNPIFVNYDLWLAEYVHENPKVPEIWKNKGWLIWQRSQTGGEKGATGNVDHDIFNGDLNQFKHTFFNE